MEELTPRESEAITSLTITEVFKLYQNTNHAMVQLYQKIAKCYELLAGADESFYAIANLPAILAGIQRLKDEADRLNIILRAARQEILKRNAAFNA